MFDALSQIYPDAGLIKLDIRLIKVNTSVFTEFGFIFIG